MIRGGIKTLASLRLTAALFVLAMLLIFVGTIAQARLGVWQVVDTYFRAPVAWVDPALFVPGGDASAEGSWRVPIPGGLMIAGLLIVNLLAAHAVRFKATRKRIGVLVLHAGLIVLLAGEFVTGFMADEGMMSIDEGSSSSFLEDLRETELAWIDTRDPAHDRVVVVPGWMLENAARTGKRVADPRLPVEVAVRSWMANAALLHAHEPTEATRGIGLQARAESRPQVPGVDGSRTDAPAAYVTLHAEGRELGTWLVSAMLIDAQRVEIGGDVFGLTLRYRRTYLPYTLHLHEFRHDIFTGTNIARNFSSDIRLVDPDRHTDRPVRIWMNNPLRYAGRTFYQASYKPDGTGTVLQVVRNPGWLMPYVACVLVGVGMTVHFGQSLVAFLRRRAKLGPVGVPPGGVRSQLPPGTRVRFAVVMVFGLLLACGGLFRPVATGEFDLQGFAHLPVSAGGRVKPMDSAARSMLMVASGRQQIRTESTTTHAIEYLLYLVADPLRIADLPAVRVDHPDVLALLELPPEAGGRVAVSAVEPRWGAIVHQAEHAADVPARARDPFQRAVLELYHRVQTILAHAQMREPFAIPPLSPDEPWRPFREAFLDHQHGGTPHPGVAYISAMMSAASEGDAERFNSAVDAYTRLLQASMPEVMRRCRLEVLFNRASLFAGATSVYLLAFLMLCASFAARARAGGGGRLPESFRLNAAALLLAGVLVHTVAILIRMYLQDRPPVTNLYSSAVFVGWAAALVGLWMERLFPLGVAALGAATVGAGTLIIAHNLGNDGDTMQMMQAVLDSNFWLATHVITITLGYSAAFLAGALAIIYILAKRFTSAMNREREQAMMRMIYGVVCFTLLLSFVGTVLGGIWADQSWGRFWGWDPKENGAALVVLYSALILHARWGGLIRARGIAALAVAGNIIDAWSWFGTNMLGIGLHAYGFMESGVFWLMAFVISQFAIIGLALLPECRTVPLSPDASA